MDSESIIVNAIARDGAYLLSTLRRYGKSRGSNAAREFIKRDELAAVQVLAGANRGVDSAEIRRALALCMDALSDFRSPIIWGGADDPRQVAAKARLETLETVRELLTA